METPDIIYLSPYKQGEGQDYIGLAWTHPSESCNHVAYVRRDLIEGMIRDMKERIEQEQPEVDFEKEWDEFEDWVESYITSDYPTYYAPKEIARHFYELGLNARKEE